MPVPEDNSKVRRSSLKTREDSETRKSRNVRFSQEIDLRGMEKSAVESLEEIGRYSVWLILILVLCSWPCITLALQNSLFSLKEMLEFRCYIPELNHRNWSFEMLKNLSMSQTQSINSQCLMYDINYTYIAQMPYKEALAYVMENRENFSVTPCNVAVSDHGYFSEGYSYVQKTYLFGLCTEHYQRYLWIIALVGRLSFDFPMGIAADIFGRKIVIQIATVICFLGLLITTLASTVWEVFIGRLITTAGGYTSCLISYVYFAETCSKDYRLMYTQCMVTAWGIGYALTPVLMYNVQRWSFLHGVLMILFVINFFTMWYIPESPRWLMSRRRYKSAADVLSQLDSAQVEDQIMFVDLGLIFSVSKLIRFVLCDGMSKRLRRCAFVYATSMMLYHTSRRGLMEQGHISIYNYFIVLAVISLLHPLTAVPLLHFMGRKIAIAFLCGVLTVIYCSISIESSAHNHHNRILLFLLGVNFSENLGNVIVLYTIEMHPVNCNGTVLGFCSTCGALILVLHEFVEKELHTVLGKYLWYTVFCGLSTFLVLFLPETANKLLPLDEYQAQLLRT